MGYGSECPVPQNSIMFFNFNHNKIILCINTIVTLNCEFNQSYYRLLFQPGIPLLSVLTSLLITFQTVHVETQAGKENYICLWERCKVRGKPSCSRLWLERHTLSHGGNKPFKCIVDGCDRRFSTQVQLRSLSVAICCRNQDADRQNDSTMTRSIHGTPREVLLSKSF